MAIEFFLNGDRVCETALEADLTLLRYLRTHQDLVGTKEGCASGDCGACTVLLGEYSEAPQAEATGRWHYKSVNACILLMTQVVGRSIITVEALSNNAARGPLHPAQQALVDYHGSQCGFCTPGFIMSMAGLYDKHSASVSDALTRHDIEIALSGNLCRCTGYRPIIAAAKAMFDPSRYPIQDRATQDQGSGNCVKVWQPATPLHDNGSPAQGLTGGVSTAWAPRDEKALGDLLAAHTDATLVAGATDLALTVTQQHQRIKTLISLNEISTLKRIALEADAMVIGAAVPYKDLEQLFDQHFPEFGAMLYRLGSQQIRNSGTLGGNIVNASPIGDTPPVLLALGATIELASHSGRRTLPLSAFFLSYKVTAMQRGEYLRSIKIPRLKQNEILKVYKISKRLEDDISAILMALKVTIADDVIVDVRTGFGGMAQIPKNSPSLERALRGKPLSEDTFIQAKEMIENDFSPISDVRASAHYRLTVAKGLIEKCGIELCTAHPGEPTRIEQVSADTPV